MKEIKNETKDSKSKRSFWVWVLLISIICVGAYLRLLGTFTQSFAFTYDVGRDMLALANIIQTHKVPLIGFTTGLPGVFYGPWWYLLLLIPYVVVGGNPIGIAGFIALTGIAAIILVFIIGREVGGSWLGLLCALFVSISQALVATSSQIWNPNTAPLFVSLVFIILVWMYSKKNVSWIMSGLLGLLLGLMFDVEIVFGTLFFVGICAAIIVFLRKYIRVLSGIAFLAGMFVIFSPRIFFELRHHFLMTQAVYHTFFGNSSHAQVGPQVIERLQFFLNLWSDSLSGHFTILAMCMIVFVGASTVVFFRKIKSLEKMMLSTMWIISFVFLIGLTFFSHDIWPHYTVGIPLVFALLFAFSLFLWRNIKNAPYGIILVSLFLFWVNVQPVQILSGIGKPVFEGDVSVYRNQTAAIDYVYHEAHGQKFKYILYTPPVHDYTYQYLFAWYGKRTYGYIPEVSKANLFFVIIEPDTQMPSRLVDWLKSRENDGTIVKVQKLKGGIIVQTRLVT